MKGEKLDLVRVLDLKQAVSLMTDSEYSKYQKKEIDLFDRCVGFLLFFFGIYKLARCKDVVDFVQFLLIFTNSLVFSYLFFMFVFVEHVGGLLVLLYVLVNAIVYLCKFIIKGMHIRHRNYLTAIEILEGREKVDS